MSSYIIRRLLLTIPVLFLVVTLIFVVLRIAPGDPALSMLGEYASQEVLEAFRVKMGLDHPLYLQYLYYLQSVIRGDLGHSLISGTPVNATLAYVLPYSISLMIGGLFIGVLLGIPMGILSAIYRNHFIDYFTRLFSLAGLSVPTFYLAILLLILFCVQLNLFPSIGGGDFQNPMEILYYLFLPALTLGLILMAYVCRITRSSLLEILNEDYILVAKAKGVQDRVVYFKHALKNCLTTITSVISVYIIIMIGGSVMVEIVFSRPGLGRMLVGAAMQRDYTVIQSLLLIYALIVVVTNLITDISYGFIDPRIRYD